MRTKFLFLILSLLILILFIERGSLDQTSKSEATGKYSVTLLSPIKFRDFEVDNTVLLETNSTLLSDAFGNLGLLDLKIDMGSPDVEGVDLTEPNGKTSKLASTCREYLSLTDKGWFAYSTADMIDESYFVYSCDLLRLLQKAKPAHHTNFQKNFQWVSLNNLPRAMYYDLLKRAEEYECKESLSLLECISQDKGEITQNNNVLTINAYGGIYHYTPKARGDFNGDGWEDILLFHDYNGTDSSFKNYFYGCLTWSGEQDSLALTDCGKTAD